MGAVERDGYIFDIEYSVIQQKGEILVYQKGTLIDDLSFSFNGKKPDEHQIESLIDAYIERTR